MFKMAEEKVGLRGVGRVSVIIFIADSVIFFLDKFYFLVGIKFLLQNINKQNHSDSSWGSKKSYYGTWCIFWGDGSRKLNHNYHDYLLGFFAVYFCQNLFNVTTPALKLKPTLLSANLMAFSVGDVHLGAYPQKF